MITLRKTGWLGAVLLALLAWAPVQAAEEGKAHIVLVGISDYTDTQIKDRQHAEADIKALYDLFTNTKYLGASKDHVKLLLGSKDGDRPSEKATKENVLKAIQWVAKEAGENDPVLFAFIGQGGPLGERGDRTCYFAVDSTLKDRGKNAIAAAEISQEFEKLKSKKVCVFLDVNFKGFDAGKESIPEVSLGKNPYKEFLGDDDSIEHNPLEGRVIFLATNGLTTSPNLKEHGLFTVALLKGLKGDADEEGYEADGLVTVPELREYVNEEIPELKRKNNLIIKDPRKRDDHFVITGRASRFVLTTNPDAIGRAKTRLTKFEKIAKSGDLPDNLADEGARFLSRMPKLEAQRKLRKEYQKLVDGEITVARLKSNREEILATLRLPRSVSTRFAGLVMDAIGRIDEEYVKEINKGEMVSWAIRGLYERIDEKIPADVARKLRGVKSLGDRELALLLRDVRSTLGKREDLAEHKDIDHALQRMLARLDPYTTYIDPEAVKRFESEYRGHFTGIGVQIRKDLKTDMLQVVSPILGSPSYKKGLMAGDLIQTVVREVDSEGNPLDPPEVLHTKDMTLTEAVKKILGKAGTKVKLKIVREGVKNPFYVEIIRNRIELESVMGFKRKKDDTWTHLIDPVTKIGYVRLSNFAANTTKDLAKILVDLKKQGMRGFILDLRFNPGGLLNAARDIADLFIDDGLIVSIRPRGRRQYRISGRSPGSQLDYPMVVLINGYSASASEIVSACLQDYKRAVVVGERSYGKGSVQNIQPFDGGQLKMTTATFWRPSGVNLNKSSTSGKDNEDWGVTPNKGFLVELSKKERDDLAEHQSKTEMIPRKDKPVEKSSFKDRQLDVALKYLREQISGATKRDR